MNFYGKAAFDVSTVRLTSRINDNPRKNKETDVSECPRNSRPVADVNEYMTK